VVVVDDNVADGRLLALITVEVVRSGPQLLRTRRESVTVPAAAAWKETDDPLAEPTMLPPLMVHK
jgi:hypothetical protein